MTEILYYIGSTCYKCCLYVFMCGNPLYSKECYMFQIVRPIMRKSLDVTILHKYYQNVQLVLKGKLFSWDDLL